jgi:hypothetical protein
MGLTTLARVVIAYQQIQNGMQNAQAGAAKMRPGHLPPRLNCPWRATATTAMVRSALSVPTATIGAVRLAVHILATSASVAAMPA